MTIFKLHITRNITYYCFLASKPDLLRSKRRVEIPCEEDSRGEEQGVATEQPVVGVANEIFTKREAEARLLQGIPLGGLNRDHWLDFLNQPVLPLIQSGLRSALDSSCSLGLIIHCSSLQEESRSAVY